MDKRTETRAEKHNDPQDKHIWQKTEDQLYDLLIHFVIQPGQLFMNGFPELNEHNEVGIFKHCFPCLPLRGPYGRRNSNSDTDSDQNPPESSISSLPVLNRTVGVERTCVRCYNPFVITESQYITKERCVYHWGRLIYTFYSCCRRAAGAAGCSSSKYHVWNGTVDGINERLQGFVKTKGFGNNRKRKVYAIDCEMCYTVKGLELCKVIILGFNGTVVYEHFVKPEYEVIDYNTRYSGVTEYDVNGVNSKCFAEVQKDLLGLIGEETILLGHSLDNDLRVLKLLHSRVVDTSLVFLHERGYPYRYSLKHLMLTHLHKQIQASDTRRNSYEGAMSCLELMIHKIHSYYGIVFS